MQENETQDQRYRRQNRIYMVKGQNGKYVRTLAQSQDDAGYKSLTGHTKMQWCQEIKSDNVWPELEEKLYSEW